MEILGDADILRSLTERGAWLNSYGPILIGLGLLAWAISPSRSKKEVIMTGSKKTIVGLDIQNSGGGVGVDIRSNGTIAEPSMGGQSIVEADEERTAIGTRVIQSGPGTGLSIVQNGPGVGFSSSVVVGKRSPGD